MTAPDNQGNVSPKESPVSSPLSTQGSSVSVGSGDARSGLAPAFEWVGGVLYQQVKMADGYADRLTTLLSVASGIVGIGLPFGAKALEGRFEPFTGSFIAVLIAVVAYFLIVLTALAGLWMRRYNTLDSPKAIRELYPGRESWQVKEEILRQMQDAYERNKEALKWRVWPVQAIVILLPIEAFALAGAFLLAL